MHAMDGVKAAITRISSEILRISEAAINSDFSVRSDESKYQHGFRQMGVNLCQLMLSADGNLSARIEGAYQWGGADAR